MPARKRAQEAKRRVRRSPPALPVVDQVEAAWGEHDPCVDGRHCPCGLGYCCTCGPYEIDSSAEEIAAFRTDPASRP